MDAGLSYSLENGKDGKKEPWLEECGLVYVNPPYGRGMVRPWVEACIDEHWANPSQDIVLMVKCDPGVRWYQHARDHCCAYANPYKRIRFNRGTKDNNAADFSSTIFYWGDRLTAFLRAMDGKACVMMGDQAFNSWDLRDHA